MNTPLLLLASLVAGAVALAADADTRCYEMRTYYAAPGKFNDMHARFRNHTVKLFEKHGISNFGYWTPAEGEQGAADTLVYLVVHQSRNAAKASFDAFPTDPDWLKARKESEEKAGGALTVANGVKSVFLTATDYSPTR